MDGITQIFLDSYAEHPFSRAQGKYRLPCKQGIVELIDSLLDLIYPRISSTNNTAEYVSAQLSKTKALLIYEMTSAFLVSNCEKADKTDLAQLDSHLNLVSDTIFLQISQIRKIIQTDIDAAFDGDPAAEDKNIIIAAYPGLYAITVQRLAHILAKQGIPYLPRMMTEHAHSITGIDIHPSAVIGKRFFIDHGTGIVIGETTEIGDNVKLYQGVTLGALSTRGGQSLKGKKRHPTIKNNVTIYANATVLGGDTVIGDNVTIGGNAFITSSVFKEQTKKGV